MRGSKLILALLVAALFVITGCSAKMSGAVRDDVSITGQSDKLKAEGADYRGPQYTVAIMTFKNKTPSKRLGLGESATDILRTIVKQAGLEPIMLSKEELETQDELIALQQSGALKTGKKDAAAGLESVDYRISGSITAYSELAESSDILVAQSKTVIARVSVDYALVDIATGKSLLADSGSGVYKKKTGGILGFGSKSTADAGLRDGALRDALSKAMTNMMAKLNSIPFTSKIVMIDGGDILIRAGTKSRLSEGTELGVYRTGKKIIDPDTGRVLSVRLKKIGEIVISGHEGDRVSSAIILSGKGFKRGDIVKVIN